ncbi:hypothetical protein E2C01_055148 [Portunus trituberculatus]|uniref:Uncharacterized protein n=1 Tax=Portunus trituberculatus TaxID=210409 RepID=A0A5B7GUI3_PORTR|nr:hypothetical protein [Portunus trituberculatus]
MTCFEEGSYFHITTQPSTSFSIPSPVMTWAVKVQSLIFSFSYQLFSHLMSFLPHLIPSRFISISLASSQPPLASSHLLSPHRISFYSTISSYLCTLSRLTSSQSLSPHLKPSRLILTPLASPYLLFPHTSSRLSPQTTSYEIREPFATPHQGANIMAWLIIFVETAHYHHHRRRHQQYLPTTDFIHRYTMFCSPANTVYAFPLLLLYMGRLLVVYLVGFVAVLGMLLLAGTVR